MIVQMIVEILRVIKITALISLALIIVFAIPSGVWILRAFSRDFGKKHFEG